MAEAPVLVQDLERGDMPPVCVKTGVPCTTLYRQRWWMTPQWMLWLFLAGVVPFVMAAVLGSEKVEGRVPMSQDAYRRMRLLSIARVVACLAAGGSVATVFALGDPSDARLISMAALCAFAVAVMLAARYASVEVEPGKTRSTVVLKRVHPEFARALGRREGQRLRAGLASSVMVA